MASSRSSAIRQAQRAARLIDDPNAGSGQQAAARGFLAHLDAIWNLSPDEIRPPPREPLCGLGEIRVGGGAGPEIDVIEKVVWAAGGSFIRDASRNVWIVAPTFCVGWLLGLVERIRATHQAEHVAIEREQQAQSADPFRRFYVHEKRSAGSFTIGLCLGLVDRLSQPAPPADPRCVALLRAPWYLRSNDHEETPARAATDGATPAATEPLPPARPADTDPAIEHVLTGTAPSGGAWFRVESEYDFERGQLVARGFPLYPTDDKKRIASVLPRSYGSQRATEEPNGRSHREIARAIADAQPQLFHVTNGDRLRSFCDFYGFDPPDPPLPDRQQQCARGAAPGNAAPREAAGGAAAHPSCAAKPSGKRARRKARRAARASADRSR